MRFLGILTLLGTVAMTPATGDAQCRRIVAARRVVVAPYVAPVYHAAVVQQVAIAVPVQADYVYSLGSYYQSQLLADAIVGRLTLLQQQQAAPAPKTGPFKPANAEPEPAPGKASAAPASLQALVQAKCIRCHGPQKKEGNFDMTNLDAIPPGRRWECVGRVASEDMPRAGGALTDAELDTFQQWAAGTKQ